MKRVVVLISGRGSNMKSLIAHQNAFEVKAVLSNRAEAAGLLTAQEAGIHTASFCRKSFCGVKEQKAALYSAIRELNPDYIVLAGYMQIVEASFVEEFYGRMVNIHPSLLPSFPGLDTHRRAIDAGCTEHGCSVHFVDAGVDTGPVIAQAKCAVEQDDTEETLAARVLEKEHQLFPWALNLLCKGEIEFSNNLVSYSETAEAEAEKLGFLLAGKAEK